MKTFAKIIAGVWLLFVLVMGIGGTWMTHKGPEVVAEMGGEAEGRMKAQAERRAKAMARRIEERELAADGWDSGSDYRADDGWGAD